ncbi:hypothetical protein EB796_017563 [Bugula neritina]|uniref:Uncharacterized protein n=1 Tax=Bugula neritina TaxID=10212 RepID=A0A7J7JEU9_BUGNE|nr:hypothetical protein EB796_017563 [Bugula neritina]
MMREYNGMYKKLVTDSGGLEKHYHHLKEYQWVYISELYNLINREPPSKSLENLYYQVHKVRRASSLLFKQARYKLSEETQQGFIIIYEPPECQICA